jgi:hypothetical protein
VSNVITHEPRPLRLGCITSYAVGSMRLLDLLVAPVTCYGRLVSPSRVFIAETVALPFPADLHELSKRPDQVEAGSRVRGGLVNRGTRDAEKTASTIRTLRERRDSPVDALAARSNVFAHEPRSSRLGCA